MALNQSTLDVKFLLNLRSDSNAYEDFEEMYKSFDDEKIFAACLQETWREGIEQLGRTGKVIKTIFWPGKHNKQEEVLVALGSPLVKKAFRRGRTQDRRSSTILVHV